MTDPLTGRTVLVTGANGGLGRAFVRQALAYGARRVYAAARTPRGWDDDRVEPITLDVRDSVGLSHAALGAPDVDLVVNNAAVLPADDLSLLDGDEDVAWRVFDTNVFGAIRVTKAFAPVLAANGGGALLNVVSAVAWLPVTSAYAASKAALWSVTNALRVELADQRTAVTALFVGGVDTPMAARSGGGTSSPDTIAGRAYVGVAAGAYEVLADVETLAVRARLGDRAEEFAAWVQAHVSGFRA